MTRSAIAGPMTIKDLIEMLEGYDSDLDVTVADNRNQNLLAVTEILFVTERNAMVIYTGGIYDD